jgi:hypothetical protein
VTYEIDREGALVADWQDVIDSLRKYRATLIRNNYPSSLVSKTDAQIRQCIEYDQQYQQRRQELDQQEQELQQRRHAIEQQEQQQELAHDAAELVEAAAKLQDADAKRPLTVRRLVAPPPLPFHDEVDNLDDWTY